MEAAKYYTNKIYFPDPISNNIQPTQVNIHV